MNSLEFINEQIEMMIEYINELKEDIDRHQRLLETSGDPLNAYTIKSTKETINYVQMKIKNFEQIKCELEAWEVVKDKKVDIYQIIHSYNFNILTISQQNDPRCYQLNEQEYETIKKALEVEDESK